MPSKKNSFVSIAEQISLLNKNSVEVLSRISDIVSSSDSVVNVTQLDEQGNETNYSLPTVGKLQSDINTINNNIMRLSGLNDNNVHIIDGKSTKKVYLSDLNREPNNINLLGKVTQFNSKNNWFFESLMNPLISLQFDMTDKVDRTVDGVISRRYIVSFERDSDGEYTTNGLKSRNDFIDKFVNNDNINYNDFINWYTNPTNLGVINNRTMNYDEQHFTFDYQEITEHGIFSILKQDIDTINNKMWYHIYPFNYATLNGEEKTLKSGDELVLNKQESVTRWKIIETSVSESDFRIRVERIEGFDPLPTGTNVLKFYGNVSIKKTVNISVGFDEYLVVFMKPTNSKNRIKGSVWSKGTGLYTNDLVLSTDNSVSMAQYYLDTVYDYGELLRDLINKTIPSQYAIKPDSPVLNNENFKVVQINKHLTNTPDTKKLKDLNSEKNKIKTKLDQVNNSISQKNKELSVKKYQTIAEKDKSQNELTKLVQEQESLSKLMQSITTQIKSQSNTLTKSEPKFRVRGFWNMPEPKTQAGYRPQEVVQFNIQYRYSSKSGLENQTEGYSVITSNEDVRKTGYFSNWVSIKSDLRKRVYDDVKREWVWKIEDISEADTPNINQLDIPIQQGEKVEIRVSSISEVGYPDSIIESDWSDIITVEFPDDLNDILDSNQYILDEASQDNMVIQFEQTLESKGINRHVRDSFTLNDQFIAHYDDNIQTGYKDDTGESFTLKEYLEYLTNKIKSLEDIVYSAKGKLKVSIFNGIDEINVDNNSTVNLDFICEKNAIRTIGSQYKNNIYVNTDYYIKLENISNTQLSFLVRDNYNSGTTIRTGYDNLPCLVDKDNQFVVQEPNQFIYFCDKSGGELLYSGNTFHDPSIPGYSKINSAIISTDKLPGLSGDYINKGKDGNLEGNGYNALGEGTPLTNNDWYIGDTLATLICPSVNSINDLISIENIGTNFKSVNPSDYIIIPFNIYWRFKTAIDTIVNLNTLSQVEHNKSIRIRLNPSSLNSSFEFSVKFNIKRKNN